MPGPTPALMKATAEYNDDTAHGHRISKGSLGKPADEMIGDRFHVSGVDIMDPKAIEDESPEQRWERLDSDAHMSVYLQHEGQWYHAAYHIGTAVASAPILTLPYQMAGLGWEGGLIALVLGGVVTCYSTYCLAEMHEVGNVRRNRYRDIGKAIYGRTGGLVVATFQFCVLILTGFQVVLLGGEVIKAIYQLYTPLESQSITTWEWTCIYACVYLCIAQIPNFHASRWFNFSINCSTVLFVIIATVMSIYTGYQTGRQDVSYAVSGSHAHKYFQVFAGIAGMALAYGDTVQPEIQSTLRSPSIPKMKKATYAAYVFLAVVFFLPAVSGYWAFGNSVDVFVLGNIVGPKWVSAVAWALVAYQNLGTSLVYCQPIFELASSRMSDPMKGVWSLRNFVPRLIFRSAYILGTGFVGVLFPYVGDFITLSGAVAFMPLDFVIPFILYNKCMVIPMWRRGIHWVLILTYGFVALNGAAAAIRGIVIDTSIYSVFANVSLTDVNAAPAQAPANSAPSGS